jgi:hypothetical protein
MIVSELDTMKQSVPSDFYDRVGEGLGGFLGQIVADTTRDSAVFVFARKLRAIGTGIQMWCTIGIAFKGNRRNADDWPCGS